MAGKDLNYRINVNAAAGTAGIKDFSRAVKNELRQVDQSLTDTSTSAQKVAQSLGRMADQAEAELKSAAKAADALARALGPEMAATMGRDGIAQKIGDLNRLGLSFDEIEQDADELAAAIKRIDAVQVSAQDQGLGALGDKSRSARGELDEMTDSAKGANNALANVVGNTAQDLGSMAGAAGTAGVALGQMAEYAADAALGGENLRSSLGSMVAIAGPIAAVTVAVSALGSIFSAAAERAQRAAKYVGLFADAAGDVDKVTDSIAGMADELGRFNADARTPLGGFVEGVAQAAKAIPGLGGLIGDAGQNVTDVIKVFNQLGISAADVSDAVVKSGAAWDSLAVDLDAAYEAGLITSAQHKAAIQVLTELRDAQEKSVELTKFTTAARKEETEATTDQARAFKESEDAVEAERRAHLRNNAALYESIGKHAELRTASERLADMATHTARQFDAIRASLDMDAAVQDFQVNFLTAIAKVQEGTALTGDEILGLKSDILSVADYAGLNPIQVKALMQAIDDGNIRGVMALAQSEIDKVRLEAEVNLVLAQGSRAWVNGRSGPPIARSAPAPAPDDDDDALASVRALGAGGPTATPAGSSFDLGTITIPVTAGATVPVTVDMRGAILGGRYDVARLVRTAVRDGVRLAGSRT